MTHPAAWAGRPGAAGPDVAVLITGSRDVEAAIRGYRTMLPRAGIWLFGSGLSTEERTAAEAAGAVVRDVPPSGRDALVRRMLAEVDAEVYILAHGAAGEDVCVAPLAVAEVEGGKDLVDVGRFADSTPVDAGDRLLRHTVDFVFGPHGDALSSDFKACSRRFALSYRRSTPSHRGVEGSARALALHALRLRLPVGHVTAPGIRRDAADPVPARDIAGWVALLGLVARLLVEERPRRVFGLLGLAVMAAGIAAALPILELRHGRATLPLGPRALAASGLAGAGAAIGTLGLLLDTLASARQEVRRLGAAAIPRRLEPAGPSSKRGTTQARVPRSRLASERQSDGRQSSVS